MTLSDVITNVRYLINDTVVTISDIFEYENDNIFVLTSTNAIAITEVYVNGVSSGVGHTFADNQVTITSPLSSGDTVKIIYTTYLNYSDTELKNYVRQAIMYLSVYKYYTWEILDEEIFTEPTDDEANLIAIVTASIIEPDNKSISLPDLKITSSGGALSLADKIKQIIANFKRNSGGVFFRA